MSALNFFSVFFILGVICQVQATSTETAGDVLQLAIPAVGYVATWTVDDPDGRPPFYKSAGANFLLSHTLKRVVQKPRPNGSNNLSFPSAHTSSAFQGAAFVHFRYGPAYAAPLYLAAGFVGYSRVYANKHDYVDVAAGAILGTLCSWYFTDPLERVSLTPTIDDRSAGLNINVRW